MTLWSGGFGSAPDDLLWSYTVDTSDRRLLADDVRGSEAHVGMLAEQGILSESDSSVLLGGLGQIAAESREASFVFADTDEDVHSAVERRLIELVGDVGRKLHTGRSRNDQIALDLRLYLARSGRAQVRRIATMAAHLVNKAEEVAEIIVPSYTHLQQAQAVPLAHHLLAYGEMLRRDAERMRSAVGRIEVSPLGAGASGGSSLPLDPTVSARLLGWQWHFVNSMDAVASRDFVAEYIFVCAQAMTHLSRLAEELILWSTAEFAWVSFPDSFTTGSSAMPQKKNPDVAELVRGRTAGVIGDVASILTLQKGLPLTYNRDLQEDKRLVFHADDVLAGSLETLGPMLASATFDPPPPLPEVTALDLAEALVKRGIPFRTAHETVGRLIQDLSREGRTLAEATVRDLTGGGFIAEDLALIDPAGSVRNRITAGGGSFSEVERQLRWMRESIIAVLEDPEG